MELLEKLTEKVLRKEKITKDEALKLYDMPLEELCGAADRIRKHFCKDGFDICTIVNGKSGRCSENCKYCAQSSFYHTSAKEYSLLDKEEILRQARYNAQKGVLRYSIVTSGKKLPDKEVDEMCDIIKEIRKTVGISVCVSFGLLNKEQFAKLKEAGASRVHNNLETSRRNFPNVCTTHTFDDKIQAIQAAKEAGLTVCSGGILGLGETVEDRIDLALSLRELEIKSVPINLLNPIPGTPYENNPVLSEEEMRRTVAVFRFLLPEASLRLAGGRGLLKDKGESCFCSGANAVISGDMLTTSGYTIDSDMKLIKKLGYKAELCNE
ncbi:biotin synthase BioB [Blautia sp. An249]|uniref:biotin synthase BioB n=1 Tax=Blautia sp. An249 TaxID=1965603 RepID=UPI000B389BF1|nr:biotin synthase BioB [Blautia sp. An249]OUO77193.1 biotin synthase BioB [Blautia sp. An249]